MSKISGRQSSSHKGRKKGRPGRANSNYAKKTLYVAVGSEGETETEGRAVHSDSGQRGCIRKGDGAITTEGLSRRQSRPRGQIPHCSDGKMISSGGKTKPFSGLEERGGGDRDRDAELRIKPKPVPERLPPISKDSSEERRKIRRPPNRSVAACLSRISEPRNHQDR